MKQFFPILFVILGIVFFVSCEDEKYLTSPDVKLVFSVDTVRFDTVFTTIGSTTKHLKVYNPYDQPILVSSVRLAGGESSNFRLNVNGIMANEVYGMEIAPKDSIYIFVEVTIDPTGQNLPMVVKDSIEFTTNMNLQDVKLTAWGQDFHLIRSQRIPTTTWTSEKPYLVYHQALVDSGAVLTIEPGTRIYFHRNAGLYVRGTVKAKGTFENPIIFQGDRLEESYANIPDQWDGILLVSGSHNNEFDFVTIKNASIGLQVGTIEHLGYATVSISNTRIKNMAYAGIFALKSGIKAYNCVISNCGFYAAALLVGGSYEFYHTTIANYWGELGQAVRQTPALLLSNKINIGDKTYIGDLEKAYFGNSIVVGNSVLGGELDFGISSEALFNYRFENCILQVSDQINVSNSGHFSNIQKNVNPRFIDPYKNHQLDTLSPAKDAGKIEIGKLFPLDMNNQSRISDAAPDLGAFERIEKNNQ